MSALLRPVIPLGDCPSCGTQTLLYAALDERGALVRRCTVCDHLFLGAEEQRVDYFGAGELSGTGFDVTAALGTGGDCGGQGCGTEGCASCDHVEECQKSS